MTWEILADQLNENQSVDISFSFVQALEDVSFTIADVDANPGDFTDSIIVVDYYSGIIVYLTLTASGANVLITTNTAVGQNPVDDFTGNTSNVLVKFNTAIDSIIVFMEIVKQHLPHLKIRKLASMMSLTLETVVQQVLMEMELLII